MKAPNSYYKKSSLVIIILAIFNTLGITGCATVGPTYSTMKKDIASLSNEKGRIVFYRPSGIYGYAVRPEIFLDGELVGVSKPGTIFHVDVDSGKHQVTIPVVLYPGETKFEVEISKNETLYIKNSMGGSAIIGRTNIEIVSPEKALTEIDELEFLADPKKSD